MATTAGLQIVDAREDHAAFIGWVVLTAARSHVGHSLFDAYVGGSEEDRLQFLETLVATDARHFIHYTNFIVAEVDGRPAAALSAYFAEAFSFRELVRGTREVSRRLGWTREEHDGGWQRAADWLRATSLCRSEHAARAWIAESVATRPEHQRQGLVDALLPAIFDVGRGKGASTAETSVFIGNDRAQLAYEKAGLVVVDEQRHPDFEAIVGCPGERLLRRAI